MFTLISYVMVIKRTTCLKMPINTVRALIEQWTSNETVTNYPGIVAQVNFATTYSEENGKNPTKDYY